MIALLDLLRSEKFLKLAIERGGSPTGVISISHEESVISAAFILRDSALTRVSVLRAAELSG